MATDIDSLQIQINAQANKANDAIDKLVGKLDRLTTSLSKVDGSKLNGLANGVQRLGTAMQSMNTIKTADFTRLAKNLEKLGSVNTSALNSAASSMSHLTRAFNSLGTVSANAATVGDLAKNISKLGNKSVQTAIANIPQLATSLNGLMTTLSKAPRVSQSVIQMTNALANLTAQGSKVGSASSSIVNGLNKTSSSATKAKKGFGSLASIFGKFYANCFLIIRGLKQLKTSIEGTADYLEAFNYFEVALNKVGGDWSHQYEQYGYASAEAYADSFKTRLTEKLSGLSGVKIEIDADGKNGLLTDSNMKNLGLNIQEVTQYASQLASVTNSVGQTGKTTLAAASAFTKLGADMSSLFNQDYSSVMKNLQSGLIGQSRALYKYGIDITNATLQTYAYNLGVEKAVSEMTQAEKMQLRMIAILDQSKVAWGDQANTINSLSNTIRQFKNNIKEAGMILGQLFVPILTKIMPIVNGLTIAIKRLMVNIAGIMGIKIDLSSFGQGTSDITDEMDGLGESLDGVAESAKKAKAGIRGFDELNVINTSSDTGSGTSGAGGSIDLTEDILKATEAYEKAWKEAYDKMENRAQAFADRIENALEPVKKIFQDFAIGDYFQAGQDVSNLVVGINNFFANAIDNVDWYGIGTKIGDFLAGVDLVGVLSSIGKLIWEAINAGIELWKGSFDTAPIETTIVTAFALLNFTPITKTLYNVISSIMNLSTLLKGGLISGESLTFIQNLGNALALAAGGAGSLHEVLVATFGFVSTIVAGITVTVSGALIAITSFADMLINKFSWIKEVLMVIGIALAAVGAIILGAPALVAGVIAGIVAAVATLVIVIKDNWDSICDFTKGLWDKVSGFFIGLWEDIVDIFTPVANWFSEHVIEPVVGFFKGLWTRVKQIFEGLWIIVQAVWIVVSGWFNDHVITPIVNFFSPIVAKIGGFFTDLWDGIKSVWNRVSSWFEEKIITPISNAFKNACEKISGFFKTLWSGIKKGVSGPMNAVISGVESAINFLVKGVNSVIKGFNKVVEWAANVVGVDWGGVDLVPKVSLGRINVSGYANGGFIEPNLPNRYSLFTAGEGGVPEILGTVGGRPAVAGGAEITGISDTIREKSNEEIALLRQQNALLQALLEKETGITKDDVGRAAQSYARDYFRRTGKEAFVF